MAYLFDGVIQGRKLPHVLGFGFEETNQFHHMPDLLGHLHTTAVPMLAADSFPYHERVLVFLVVLISD
jgi:hypothetical protein